MLLQYTLGIMQRKYILSDKPQQGLIRIINIQSDKTLLVPSKDIAKDISAIRFALDLGQYPCASLQEEYETIGLELFSIEPYCLVEKDQNLLDLLDREKCSLARKGISFYPER